MDDFRASSGLLISITTSVIEWRKNARPKWGSPVCAAGKKEIFWAQKYRNFACERSREEDFFLFFLCRRVEEDWMNAKVKLRRTINSILLAQQTNRSCEFKRTRFNTNYLTFTWGTPFKHKEEEATTTTTTTTVLWLSLVLLLHELEEWSSGLPLLLPLLHLLLRWVVLNNNNNNFKIKNKRWCYER